MQALFEKLALEMMDYYLGDIIRETGKIAFAGGCALNVKLNQKIIAREEVKELFVQPASGDAGTAVGAAAYVSVQRGVPVEKMEHVYLGPSYSNEDVIAACARHPNKPVFKQIANTPERIARIMVDGNPVAWFQGRMEFGPRALGGRSIIGCPSVPHQRADQVPRALETLLPVDARYRGAADAQGRPSEPIHDIHLRGQRRLEGACRRGGP